MNDDRLGFQIERFLQTLAAEKGYSTHTIRAYAHDLEEFARHAAGEQDAGASVRVTAIDGLTLRGYLGGLHRRNEKSTIARKLSALRSFFRFLVKQRIIEEDPSAAILTPKHGRHMPSFLSVDDMFRLLDQTAEDTLLERRNRAMFETLYGSGIRVSELTGLNVFDVDFSSGCLRVSGKGGPGAHRSRGTKGPGAHRGLSTAPFVPDRNRYRYRWFAIF